MARSKEGYTPKEHAYEIALGWLRHAYHNQTGDIGNITGSPTFKRDTRVQLAKLHNKLLEQSGLDGTLISEDVPVIEL